MNLSMKKREDVFFFLIKRTKSIVQIGPMFLTKCVNRTSDYLDERTKMYLHDKIKNKLDDVNS